MTRLTYSKEENRQATLQAEAASHEAGQILHLKRLLVTLKQHYEKSLHQVQLQLQGEQSQRLIVQKELEKAQFQLTEAQKLHEEELQALRDQQSALKELLKKSKDELNQLRQQSDVAAYLPEQQEQIASLKTEQLYQELNEEQKRVKALEQELLENKQKAQKEIENLQQLLEEQKQQGYELETVVSTTSSHHLRRELEIIKRTLAESAQETKALEIRYIEILNEKVGLEHQCRQLQVQLEHQSSNITSFQEQLRELENCKKNLETSLQAKEAEWAESCQRYQELEKRVEYLSEQVKEKEFIQDKYEQLKDEWKQLSENLEETVEMRLQADQHVNHLEAIAANQETQLQEFAEQLQILHQEKGNLETERDQLKTLLEESETRLKVAQQHLAKKVKETAVLSEKLEEQQLHLNEFDHIVEQQKTQLAQLNASVELYQKQEKRLQEQLHEALKGTESQIIKWEEKYFRMYDKWQESENKVRELKKFEEKHLQMQSLLANLGNFMGGAFNPSSVLFHAGQDLAERPIARSFSFETPLAEEPLSDSSKDKFQQEKYDVFGMRQPPENSSTPLST